MPVFGLDYGGGDIFTGGDQCVDDLFERSGEKRQSLENDMTKKRA